jgi:hypothetical protein
VRLVIKNVLYIWGKTNRDKVHVSFISVQKNPTLKVCISEWIIRDPHGSTIIRQYQRPNNMEVWVLVDLWERKSHPS